MFLGTYHFAILVYGKHFNKSVTNSNESLSAHVVFFFLIVAKTYNKQFTILDLIYAFSSVVGHKNQHKK